MAAAWTNQWIRELSWRELKRMVRHELPPNYGRLEKTRQLRLESEWKRRKREGGGGLAAKAS